MTYIMYMDSTYRLEHRPVGYLFFDFYFTHSSTQNYFICNFLIHALIYYKLSHYLLFGTHSLIYSKQFTFI